MEKAKVYFTDFRTVAFGDGLPTKLKKMISKAGIGEIDMDGKFVAIKLHFGELGNVSYLRPNYARAVADLVKELGGKPFLTDCNTMYPGKRKNALEHLECAWENGFSPLSVGCPILIGDGLKGTDDIAVPVVGGEYVKEAKIGRAVMDADVFISLTHFKGHEMTGFGGAIKNIGMGCGSRAGKTEQHSGGKASIDEAKCRGCMACLKECANEGLFFDEEAGKMRVNKDNCVGCGRCITSCLAKAIAVQWNESASLVMRKMAEYAKGAVHGKEGKTLFLNFITQVSPACDCYGHADAPIVNDIGICASTDPVALDQACADLVNNAHGNQDTALSSGHEPGGDKFRGVHPDIDWEVQLEHAEKIGLGKREYELVRI